MSNYTPPSGSSIPFVFTEAGYTPPTGDLLFKFSSKEKGSGSLSAAIQVMQLYHDEAYTYTKLCPKYIVGYTGGKVQIIKGPCIFGGIRDLRCSLEVAVQPSGFANLNTTISTHLPKDISGFLRAFQHGFLDLQSTISTHLPKDLKGILKPVYEVNADLYGLIYGWQSLGVTASILSHLPVDLQAYLSVKQRQYTDLGVSVSTWQIKGLQARINEMFLQNLPVTLSIIQPVDLQAYLKVRYASDLKNRIMGFDVNDLGAFIDVIFSRDLPLQIYGRDDMYGDLHFNLKGYARGVAVDLNAFINPMSQSGLSAFITARYIGNLTGYLFAVRPRHLKANLYGWAVSCLSASLNVQKYPWDLTASLTVGGYFEGLKVEINPVKAVTVLRNLKSSLHSWEVAQLSGGIMGINSPQLSATLIPVGYSRNLYCSITPKMIRLTAIVKVVTMEHKNLSAIINSFCLYTGYKNLSASLITSYKRDLSAYLSVLLPREYKTSNLRASIGYTNTITQVDKYKISLNILLPEALTFDRYNINVDIFQLFGNLSASIKSTMRYSLLGASITAKELDSFNVGNIKKGENVVHSTYSGVFKISEEVELSFRSLVADYYYNTLEDQAWKLNRLDRWVLEVKSFLPVDTVLGLKRRLHKETLLYDLKRFSSIDEAMRFAISYVTEYPKSDLGINIHGVGGYACLGATLNSRYTRSTTAMLSYSITSIKPVIVVGTEDGGIIKM